VVVVVATVVVEGKVQVVVVAKWKAAVV